MQLEVWADTNIGLIRKSNQDSVGCFPDLSLFIIADGMGGREEGEVASRMAVEIIHEMLQQQVSSGPPRAPHRKRQSWWRLLFGGGNDGDRAVPDPGPDGAAARLRAAIERANERIYEFAHTESTAALDRSMGTTVIALECAVDAQRAQWAYVGDSRLYRVRDGELTLLTADHTLFGEAFWNQDTIPPDLPHTNRLMRAVGISPYVEVSIGSSALRAGDLYLLCSDGVSGMVKPAVLLEGLLANQPLAETGQTLIQQALDAGGKDNASALLVKVVDR